MIGHMNPAHWCEVMEQLFPKTVRAKYMSITIIIRHDIVTRCIYISANLLTEIPLILFKKFPPRDLGTAPCDASTVTCVEPFNNLCQVCQVEYVGQRDRDGRRDEPRSGERKRTKGRSAR